MASSAGVSAGTSGPPCALFHRFDLASLTPWRISSTIGVSDLGLGGRLLEASMQGIYLLKSHWLLVTEHYSIEFRIATKEA
jgi:hypothetical protein